MYEKEVLREKMCRRRRDDSIVLARNTSQVETQQLFVDLYLRLSLCFHGAELRVDLCLAVSLTNALLRSLPFIIFHLPSPRYWCCDRRALSRRLSLRLHRRFGRRGGAGRRE